MTEQRALEIVKDLIPYMSEVDEEAMNIVERAVEKQIAKKLKTKLCEEEIYNAGGFTRKVKRYFCPVCDSFIEHGKHCYNCGQKLDWSEV